MRKINSFGTGRSCAHDITTGNQLRARSCLPKCPNAENLLQKPAKSSLFHRPATWALVDVRPVHPSMSLSCRPDRPKRKASHSPEKRVPTKVHGLGHREDIK